MSKATGQPDIAVKRVYEPTGPDDGTRVLVDRLWPRGLTKVAAHLDFWAKDAAPSPELRRWFNHSPDRFKEFGRRYVAELAAHPQTWSPLLEVARSEKLTLLYAAKNPACNHALVLRSFLQHRLAG